MSSIEVVRWLPFTPLPSKVIYGNANECWGCGLRPMNDIWTLYYSNSCTFTHVFYKPPASSILTRTIVSPLIRFQTLSIGFSLSLYDPVHTCTHGVKYDDVHCHELTESVVICINVSMLFGCCVRHAQFSNSPQGQ